jgi:hypothetical protein
MVHDLAVKFVRCGHQVIVVTPKDAVAGSFSVSVEDGITVVRVRNGRLNQTSRALRGIRELRLSSGIWRKTKSFLKEHPCDLIFLLSHNFFGDVVRKLKVLWRCPAYLVLRDIFPRWSLDAGVFKRGLCSINTFVAKICRPSSCSSGRPPHWGPHPDKLRQPFTPSELGRNTVSRRYQTVSLSLEKRKEGPSVWVYRWREEYINVQRVRRKVQLGTVEEYPTKYAAMADADPLRLTINT